MTIPTKAEDAIRAELRKRALEQAAEVKVLISKHFSLPESYISFPNDSNPPFYLTGIFSRWEIDEISFILWENGSTSFGQRYRVRLAEPELLLGKNASRFKKIFSLKISASTPEELISLLERAKKAKGSAKNKKRAR